MKIPLVSVVKFRVQAIDGLQLLQLKVLMRYEIVSYVRPVFPPIKVHSGDLIRARILLVRRFRTCTEDVASLAA